MGSMGALSGTFPTSFDIVSGNFHTVVIITSGSSAVKRAKSFSTFPLGTTIITLLHPRSIACSFFFAIRRGISSFFIEPFSPVSISTVLRNEEQ